MSPYLLTIAEWSPQRLHFFAAFPYFLDGDGEEDYSILTADDWETLRDFANDCAEDIDLDTLQGMMTIILNNGAL